MSEEQDKLKDKAAIYLEEINISGDTMVELDMSEQGGSMYLHDIMAGFVAELDWKGRD
jgi:hypothetical protein